VRPGYEAEIKANIIREIRGEMIGNFNIGSVACGTNDSYIYLKVSYLKSKKNENFYSVVPSLGPSSRIFA
jgi:hypothetical protein